jgi:hypothetical protein
VKKYVITRSQSGAGDWIRTDSSDGADPRYTLALDISGTMTVDVEFTVENDLTGSPICIQHEVLNTRTSSIGSDQLSPVTAFRLNITSYTSGTATLKILQG